MSRKRDVTHFAMCMAAMIREMQDGPCTALELVEVTGLRHETVLAWLRALRRYSVIYVSDWVKDTSGRYNTRAYSMGNHLDAPRRRKSRIEIVNAYRERVKKRKDDSILSLKKAA